MKFGICSEIFKEWNDIAKTIRYVKEIGYDGLEVAPFTLAPYVTDIPHNTREMIAKTARDCGLQIIGIHWVLVGPDGMYLTHPDKSVRDRTSQYLRDLAAFCRDISGDVMIFGSPKQRDVMEPLTYDQAFQFAIDTFSNAMAAFDDAGVTICMEPLATTETNFCQSAAQTAALVDAVGHPRFRMMLDTKAMTTESEDRPALIRKYADYMCHYHANDANLNGPGWGDVDFAPIFQALKDIHFDKYVSVEVFNFEPGPEAIATRSLEYMKRFI